jgi:hypothetical protein
MKGEWGSLLKQKMQKTIRSKLTSNISQPLVGRINFSRIGIVFVILM